MEKVSPYNCGVMTSPWGEQAIKSRPMFHPEPPLNWRDKE